MALSLEQLRKEVLELPADQRMELAESIYGSLEEKEREFDLHPNWIAELERRSEDVRTGKVQTIPWEEVKKELDSLT